MLEKLKQAWKTSRQKSRVKKALSTPQGRLDMMEAGYKKFSKELSGRERRKLQKDIKNLRREIARENRDSK